MTACRLLVILLMIGLAACANPPQVQVNGETLQGEWLGEFGVAAFRGTPFATPPVGDLRWRAREEFEATQEVRETLEFAPACMQSPRIVEWYRDVADCAHRMLSDPRVLRSAANAVDAPGFHVTTI